MKKTNCSCAKCSGKATNFHSRCCGAHFEGCIGKNGKYYISCEVCGKFGAYIDMSKKEEE